MIRRPFFHRLTRRAPLLGALLAVPVLAAAGFAAAGATGISLTAAGPQPATVTVGWGDTVTFTNSDSQPHVLSVAEPTGATATLPAGAAYPVTMTLRAGSKAFHESGARNGFRGTIVVVVSGSVSLGAKPSTVRYKGSLLLSGRTTLLTSPVAIEARPPRSRTWSTIATVMPSADGTFATRLSVDSGATYRATAAGDQLASAPVRLAVSPIVTIRPSGRSVTSGRSLLIFGHVTPRAVTTASLLRFDAHRFAWRHVATRPVQPGGGVAFRWIALPGLTKLRVAVSARKDAGYAAAMSPTISVRGLGGAPTKHRTHR